jgi:hypothetical protein
LRNILGIIGNRNIASELDAPSPQLGPYELKMPVDRQAQQQLVTDSQQFVADPPAWGLWAICIGIV